MTPVVPGTMADFLTELTLQAKMLEGMFDDPGLAQLRARNVSHPAIERHNQLTSLIANEGRYDRAKELETLLQMTSAFLDRATWLPSAPQTPFWSIIRDPNARTFVERRISDPAFFFDVLAELHWWGWLSQRANCALGEDEGMPDLAITVGTQTLWADVKHIRLGTAASGALDSTTKANKQIKRADAGAVGAVLIHVDREGARASFDDQIPSDVKPYVEEVTRALHPGQLRSIGHAVITWDDYFILSEPGGPTMYAVRRRAHVITHPAPRSTPLVSDDFWDLGFTGVVTLNPPASRGAPTQLPTVKGPGWQVTELFRRENEFGDGVRPSHALTVLAEPDGRVEYRFDTDFAVILACKQISLGTRSHILLVIATQRTESPIEVALAFKLYPPPAELGAFAASPSASFGYLIDNFGLPVEVGQQRGLHIPYEYIPQGSGNTNLVRVARAGDALVCCFYKHVTLPRLGAEARWVFAIDRAKYRAALRTR